MPDGQLESRCRPQFSSWGALSAQVLSYNIHVSTNIAEYWRHVAEIHVAAVMAIGRMHVGGEGTRSFYETRGLLVF